MFVAFKLQIFRIYPLEYIVTITYCIIHARKFYYYKNKFLSTLAKSHQKHFTNTMVSSSGQAKQPGLTAQTVHWPQKKRELELLPPSAKAFRKGLQSFSNKVKVHSELLGFTLGYSQRFAGHRDQNTENTVFHFTFLERGAISFYVTVFLQKAH